MASKRRKRLTGPERRRQLIEAATELLAQRGADALTLPNLAVAAGVSKPVVYDHFPDRPALVKTLLQEYSQHLFDDTARALEEHPDDIEAAVREGNRVYFDRALGRAPAQRDLFVSVAGDPEVEQGRVELRRRFTALWAERVREVTGVAPREARTLAAMFIASSEAALRQVMLRRLGKERALRLQVELVMSTLRGLAGASPRQNTRRGSRRPQEIQ
jgi:AcrR family transcriptional regulator